MLNSERVLPRSINWEILYFSPEFGKKSVVWDEQRRSESINTINLNKPSIATIDFLSRRDSGKDVERRLSDKDRSKCEFPQEAFVISG